MFRFTTSERNQQVLNSCDYQYTLKRVNKTCAEWRCRKRNCSSTLTLSLDNTCVRREPGGHNELCKSSQPSKIMTVETLEIIKKRVREETKPVSQIYSEELVAMLMRNH